MELCNTDNLQTLIHNKSQSFVTGIPTGRVAIKSSPALRESFCQSGSEPLRQVTPLQALLLHSTLEHCRIWFQPHILRPVTLYTMKPVQ